MNKRILEKMSIELNTKVKESSPDGGLGEAPFLTCPDELDSSDFAGHVGNILGSMALGCSLK